MFTILVLGRISIISACPNRSTFSPSLNSVGVSIVPSVILFILKSPVSRYSFLTFPDVFIFRLTLPSSVFFSKSTVRSSDRWVTAASHGLENECGSFVYSEVTGFSSTILATSFVFEHPNIRNIIAGIITDFFINFHISCNLFDLF